METDRLFHELFALAPQALFDLLGIVPECEYTFSSPVLKASERQLDGLLEPDRQECRRYFLEVQGYLDKSIYWRVVHEVGLYFGQRPELNGCDWQAVVLFLDQGHDPGVDTLGALNAGDWLVHGVITELLAASPSSSPILNVLRPLLARNEAEVREQASEWSRALREAEEVSRGTQELLLSLLTQFIGQKFTQLSREEIDKMLELTPIRETRLGRDLMNDGRITLLTSMIENKFGASAETITNRLELLSSENLSELGIYLFEAESFAHVESWVENALTQ